MSWGPRRASRGPLASGASPRCHLTKLLHAIVCVSGNRAEPPKQHACLLPPLTAVVAASRLTLQDGLRSHTAFYSFALALRNLQVQDGCGSAAMLTKCGRGGRPRKREEVISVHHAGPGSTLTLASQGATAGRLRTWPSLCRSRGPPVPPESPEGSRPTRTASGSHRGPAGVGAA